MNNPIRCWKCDKAFGDLIQGNIQLIPSTNLDTSKLECLPSLIEISCFRCKSLNSIIDLSLATNEDLASFDDMANKIYFKEKKHKKTRIFTSDNACFSFFDKIMRRNKGLEKDIQTEYHGKTF